MSFFKRDGYTILFQLILAFAIGLVFAAWSIGFSWFVIFIIVFELLFWGYNYNLIFYTDVVAVRLGLICSSILGLIIGRTMIGDKHPFRSHYEDHGPCHYDRAKDRRLYQKEKRRNRRVSD